MVMRNIVFLLVAAAWLASCTIPSAPFPTPTQTPTQTPAPPTATSTPIPSATPTAAVTPSVRIKNGETALFNGDYDAARLAFQDALKRAADDETRAAALWGLSRVEHAQGNEVAALISLQNLRAIPSPIEPLDAYAWYLTGEILTGQKRYQEASDAYEQYLTLRPGLIEDAVQETRGDALFNAGAYADALAAYQAAQRIHPDESLQLKIASTRTALGDYHGALTLYNEIAAASNNDYIKAQAVYSAGKIHQQLNEPTKAWEEFQLAVENYPLSYYAYLSLVELVNADIPVDDLQRGIVDYYAGQYDVALAALNRAIENAPEGEGNGTAQYYRARALQALGKTEEELQAWDDFIEGYPDNPHWEEGWEEKAYTQWAALNQYDEAAKTLLDFVAALPTHEDAPKFLMEAARIQERADDLDAAAYTWSRIADEYPDSGYAPRASFLAGIARYRMQDYDRALTHFQRSLLFSFTQEDLARAYFWIGKTLQAQGDIGSARAAWQQGQTLDPTGYYSERARDLLVDAPPFAENETNLDIDLEAERADAAAWVRVAFDLPPETDLTVPGALLNNPHLQRGTEFWNLGDYEAARAEFETLRQEVSGDPAQSFRLANYLLDLGMYRPAIFAIRQVLTLAGLQDHAASFHAPIYFGHVRYGLYYPEIVFPAAEANNLSPLFLFSVIRQESLFEGFVRSTKGARGLMQIIPATGSSISNNMNFPVNFTPEDLYRPYISVELGAHYLATNRFLMGGDLYGALAAYNAGPGNALTWKALADDDPDLFLEVIRYKETRDYIRSIYETYKIYASLYAPEP